MGKNMTIYEMAEMLDELDDYDYYEVFMALGKRHGKDTIEDLKDWLDDVLTEISDNLSKQLNEASSKECIWILKERRLENGWYHDTDIDGLTINGDIINSLSAVKLGKIVECMRDANVQFFFINDFKDMTDTLVALGQFNVYPEKYYEYDCIRHGIKNFDVAIKMKLTNQ